MQIESDLLLMPETGASNSISIFFFSYEWNESRNDWFDTLCVRMAAFCLYLLVFVLRQHK